MSELSRVLTGVSLSAEEQLKLSVELAMNNFIYAYIQIVGGDPDSQDDIDAAMSAWFKASSNVKTTQLQRFEESDEDEQDEEAA